VSALLPSKLLKATVQRDISSSVAASILLPSLLINATDRPAISPNFEVALSLRPAAIDRTVPPLGRVSSRHCSVSIPADWADRFGLTLVPASDPIGDSRFAGSVAIDPSRPFTVSLPFSPAQTPAPTSLKVEQAAILALLLIAIVLCFVVRHRKSGNEPPGEVTETTVTFTEGSVEELECENPMDLEDDVELSDSPVFSEDEDEKML
jgi:hypothetical protein